MVRFLYIIFCGHKELQNQSKSNPDEVAQGPYCVHPKLSSRPSLNKKGVNYYSLRKYYERDSAYLGLIEAFIQDGPQLVLQLYILAVRHHDDLTDPYVGTCCLHILTEKLAA